MEKHIDAKLLLKEVKRFEKAAHKSALGCADSETRKFHEGKDFAYQFVGVLIDSLQQEQQDFPTTGERMNEFLATHPKVEVPDKYKTPDWLFKKQEQPKRSDFGPNHYTKVREIKTGKEFWAEYSSEAAEWYEAGTGKAYSISDVEVVKEQPEVDLEKEIDSCWQSWISPSSQSSVEGVLPKSEFSMYARHFYELGKNSK